MTITCGIQPTNVVTVIMKVLHNGCNMCTLDLTDVYALALGPVAPVPVHTYQSNQFVISLLKLEKTYSKSSKSYKLLVMCLFTGS